MNPTRFLTVFLACFAVASLGGCIKPPRDMPGPSSIQVDGQTAVRPDCDDFKRNSHLLDAGVPRPSVAWGCATYTNLAAQIANPQDLVHPQVLGPANAAVAASAVRRYETGHVTPLDASTSRDSK